MKYFKIVLSIICVLVLHSCEQEIDMKLPPYKQTIAIDGWINDGEVPYVILTRSSAFFNSYDSVSLRKLIVTSAKVSVSTPDTTEILTLVKNTDFFPPYVYRGTKIKGKIGQTYTLKVESEGKVYIAQTEIEPPIKLDTVWSEKFYKGNDTMAVIYATITDPAETENYYRIFEKVVGVNKIFVPSLLSVWGDKFFNGQSFNFAIYRGFETLTNQNTDVYFTIGDTVVIRFCSIDKASFDFWISAEREMYTSGNPFLITDKEVKSNVSGGALGCWTGYSFTHDTLVVNPK